MKKRENAVAVVRQVAVDFINMDLEHKFPIEWETEANLLQDLQTSLTGICITP